MMNSRNNMFAVMANGGFSGCKIKASNGVIYEIPVKGIKQTRGEGVIKKAWLRRLSNCTVEAAAWLFERGAVVTKA